MIENEQYELIKMDLDERIEKTISVLKSEYAVIRAGRANPRVLDKILVDYYGAKSPINQVANISVSDARCLVIAPWDASMLKVIEKQILEDNIGLTPSNDGKVIRLVFPILTEERRKELARDVKKLAEDSKVAMRNIRRDGMEEIKKMKNDKLISEDQASTCQDEIEKIITKAMDLIAKIEEEKQKDIMQV